MQIIEYVQLYIYVIEYEACQNLHRFRDYFNQALCCTAAFSNGGVHEFIGNGSTYIRRRSFFLPFFNLCIIHRLQKNVDFINTSFLKFLRLAVFLNILIRSSMGVSEMTTCPRSSPRWGNINDDNWQRIWAISVDNRKWSWLIWLRVMVIAVIHIFDINLDKHNWY